MLAASNEKKRLEDEGDRSSSEEDATNERENLIVFGLAEQAAKCTAAKASTNSLVISLASGGDLCLLSAFGFFFFFSFFG